jgi:hypothetical protein
MRDTMEEILAAVEESLPKTNTFLARGMQPFTLDQAKAFVYEAVGRVLSGRDDSMSTMGILVQDNSGEGYRAAQVLLTLGTIYLSDDGGAG